MNDINPKVSIIIVTYNNEVWVEQCIDSLLNQNYSDIEVIWVDNGSKDKTIQLAKQNKYSILKIKFVELKDNEGFAGGNNAGFKVSTGDIIFLLNSDARIEADTITKVVKTFQKNPEIGIIQNKILLIDDPSKLDSAGSFFTRTGFLKHIDRKSEDAMDNPYPVFAGKGASLFIKRKVITKSYLFNPLFKSYFEDTDLCWRCWILGYKVIYSPEGITYHKGGATGLFLTSGTTDFNSFKNRIFSILTCLELKNLIFTLTIHILLSLFIALVYMVRGRFSKAIAIPKAILWNIQHTKDLLNYRKLIQSQRILKDKEIFRLVCRDFTFNYAYSALMGYTSF